MSHRVSEFTADSSSGGDTTTPHSNGIARRVAHLTLFAHTGCATLGGSTRLTVRQPASQSSTVASTPISIVLT